MFSSSHIPFTIFRIIGEIPHSFASESDATPGCQCSFLSVAWYESVHWMRLSPPHVMSGPRLRAVRINTFPRCIYQMNSLYCWSTLSGLEEKRNTLVSRLGDIIFVIMQFRMPGNWNFMRADHTFGDKLQRAAEYSEARLPFSRTIIHEFMTQSTATLPTDHLKHPKVAKSISFLTSITSLVLRLGTDTDFPNRFNSVSLGSKSIPCRIQFNSISIGLEIFQ